MGNCQAVDNASFVLQTQTGRSERFYSPVSAAEIMKLHPGHCVALLLTTTFYSSPPSTTPSGHHKQQQQQQQKPQLGQEQKQEKQPNNKTNANQPPLRVTRIKLLRPTDNLVLGNAYRLITNQEVLKGLKAKKNGKLHNIKDFQPQESTRKNEANSNSEASIRSNQSMKTNHNMRKSDKHRSRTSVPADPKSAGIKSRGWHPSLNSISESTS